LARQPGEDPRRPQARGEKGRPQRALAGPRPDAHARPLTPLLGEVRRSPPEPARAPRGPSGREAGRAHRPAEGLEASPAGPRRRRQDEETAEGRRLPPQARRDRGAALPLRPLRGGGGTPRLTRADPGRTLP